MVMGVCDPTVTERGGPGRFGAWVKTGMLRHAVWEVKGNALPSVGFAACLLVFHRHLGHLLDCGEVNEKRCYWKRKAFTWTTKRHSNRPGDLSIVFWLPDCSLTGMSGAADQFRSGWGWKAMRLSGHSHIRVAGTPTG